jgi:hypothetical protein
MVITGNTNTDYINYMSNQPMPDGKEIRSFFDEIKEEEKKKDEEGNKNE